MTEPNTSVASCTFVPLEKQIRKRCNLCNNPGWQNLIQVCPHVLLSVKKSNSEKDVICVKSRMAGPNTSVASCAFVPQEKQIRKRFNLCKNPGWQNPIQVCPHVLLSLKKSISGKEVIYVIILDGRTQYKCGLMCFCPSRKANPEKM